MTAAPLVLTCGDPAGIGPELAVKARPSYTNYSAMNR